MRIREAAKKYPALPWIMCILAALFYCYEFFLRVSPAVMMDQLIHRYHIDASQFGFLSGLYYSAYTPLQVVVGTLFDRYGVRRLLTFAIMICCIGTYFFVDTHSLLIAQIGRFLVGAGSAFAFVGVLKLATEWLPSNRIAFISGATTTLGMLGAISGEVTLASAFHKYGWEQTNDAAIISGIILTALTWMFVRDRIKTTDKPFCAKDIHTLKHNLVTVARIPQIWLVGLVGGLMFVPTSTFASLWGVTYLRQAYHFSTHQAAVTSTMIFTGWAIGGPIVGILSDRFKRRKIFLPFGAFFAATLFAIMLYVPNIPTNELQALLVLFGVFSSTQVLVFPIASEEVPIELTGTAIAFTNMIVMFGALALQPLVGLILDQGWTGQLAANSTRIYPITAYQDALVSLPIALFLASIFAIYIKETFCEHPTLEK